MNETLIIEDNDLTTPQVIEEEIISKEEFSPANSDTSSIDISKTSIDTLPVDTSKVVTKQQGPTFALDKQAVKDMYAPNTMFFSFTVRPGIQIENNNVGFDFESGGFQVGGGKYVTCVGDVVAIGGHANLGFARSSNISILKPAPELEGKQLSEISKEEIINIFTDTDVDQAISKELPDYKKLLAKAKNATGTDKDNVVAEIRKIKDRLVAALAKTDTVNKKTVKKMSNALYSALVAQEDYNKDGILEQIGKLNTQIRNLLAPKLSKYDDLTQDQVVETLKTLAVEYPTALLPSVRDMFTDILAFDGSIGKAPTIEKEKAEYIKKIFSFTTAGDVFTESEIMSLKSANSAKLKSYGTLFANLTTRINNYNASPSAEKIDLTKTFDKICDQIIDKGDFFTQPEGSILAKDLTDLKDVKSVNDICDILKTTSNDNRFLLLEEQVKPNLGVVLQPYLGITAATQVLVVDIPVRIVFDGGAFGNLFTVEKKDTDGNTYQDFRTCGVGLNGSLSFLGAINKETFFGIELSWRQNHAGRDIGFLGFRGMQFDYGTQENQ